MQLHRARPGVGRRTGCERGLHDGMTMCGLPGCPLPCVDRGEVCDGDRHAGVSKRGVGLCDLITKGLEDGVKSSACT